MFLRHLRLVAVLIPGLLFTACHKNTEPPPPLPVEQIAAEFQKTFGTAPEPLKKLALEISAAVTGKKYAPAFEGLQTLLNVPDLKDDQRTLASRAMLTVSTLLQEAQAQGDQTAEETLKVYRANR